ARTKQTARKSTY
nr:Chain B, Histone H3.2 [Homo sapiens]